jgi:hypothetical protein
VSAADSQLLRRLRLDLGDPRRRVFNALLVEDDDGFKVEEMVPSPIKVDDGRFASFVVASFMRDVDGPEGFGDKRLLEKIPGDDEAEGWELAGSYKGRRWE